MRRACALALVAAATVAFVACDMNGASSDACSPGDFITIPLPDGGAGFLQCTADGGGYGSYYGPNPNLIASEEDSGAEDANVDAAALCDPAANGGKLGFMCVGCGPGNPCATGLSCESFPNKGGYRCTLKCSTASQCPQPASAGCGNSGYCKP